MPSYSVDPDDVFRAEKLIKGRQYVDSDRGEAQPMIVIRVAGPGDAAAVARLEADCLGADAWSEGLVGEGIRGALPTVSYLVAESEGRIVGHAVTSAAGDIAELQRIAVEESHRRSGVAALLLAGVVEAAGRTEADRLLLEVRADNRGAIAFYAVQGFVEIDRRRRYYADGTTAVVLRLPLGRGCGAGSPGQGR